MPRHASDWRAFVGELTQRLSPVLERCRVPASPRLGIEIGGELPVSYDASSETIRLGFPLSTHDEDETQALYADLLAVPDPAELERVLELLFARLSVQALTRHLRQVHDAATDDDWLERQVSHAVAHAMTARLFEAHRPFLLFVLDRALENLGQRRLLELPDDQSRGPLGDFFLHELTAWTADLSRDDVPPVEQVLEAFVGEGARQRRRSAESELALLQTLTQGPASLRRTAAELFAEEASPEGIAAVLGSSRVLPPDVRLLLAGALRLRGESQVSASQLAFLATELSVPAPVAAAAALLLDDPRSHGVDPAGALQDLEDADLADALALVKVLDTSVGVQAVWPTLSHMSAAVRRQAYRLLAAMLPEADAWSGIADPEPTIRARSVVMLSRRPGLARALSTLVLDEAREVREAALSKARADDQLANDLGALLSTRETDAAQLALAAIYSHTWPEAADQVFRRGMARVMRPYVVASAAVKRLRQEHPADRHLLLVEQLAQDAQERRQRELIEFASMARGRSDWLELYDAHDSANGLADWLPDGWYEALNEPMQPFEPMFALRRLASDHPTPFVRAALLLWLARGEHDDPETLARLADQDPTATVTEVARILRGEVDDMALTAIEKALFLRTAPLFRSVPTPNLLALAAAMRSGEHAPGEMIVRQGDLGDRLFVLFEGQAEARKEQPSGDSQKLATLGPGAVFGEMALFDSEPRSATVVATETARTLMLDGATFHRLGLEHPEILWEVCRVLTGRLRSLGQTVGTRPPEPPPDA